MPLVDLVQDDFAFGFDIFQTQERTGDHVGQYVECIGPDSFGDIRAETRVGESSFGVGTATMTD